MERKRETSCKNESPFIVEFWKVRKVEGLFSVKTCSFQIGGHRAILASVPWQRTFAHHRREAGNFCVGALLGERGMVRSCTWQSAQVKPSSTCMKPCGSACNFGFMSVLG